MSPLAILAGILAKLALRNRGDIEYHKDHSTAISLEVKGIKRFRRVSEFSQREGKSMSGENGSKGSGWDWAGRGNGPAEASVRRLGRVSLQNLQTRRSAAGHRDVRHIHASVRILDECIQAGLQVRRDLGAGLLTRVDHAAADDGSRQLVRPRAGPGRPDCSGSACRPDHQDPLFPPTRVAVTPPKLPALRRWSTEIGVCSRFGLAACRLWAWDTSEGE